MNKKTLGLALMMSALASLPAASNIDKSIKSAVASKERPADQRKRDKYRKPAEVLSLMGLKPGMRVIDLMSGTGYYTEILSRIVGEEGLVVAHNAPYVLNRFAKVMLDENTGWLSQFKSPQWQKNVVKSTDELDALRLPLQLDGALMVLFYHDTFWQNVDRERMNQHLFNALKPGGVFLIVDHSAANGRAAKDVKTLHRIEKSVVIQELERVGFELAEDSKLLANKKDTRDFNVFRDYQTKRDRTDRFVLKFIKPMD